MSASASKNNGLEAQIERLSDNQLRQATEQFKIKIREAVKPYEEELTKTESLYDNAASSEEQEHFTNELERARENLKKARKDALDEILPDAFAIVREASKRTVGMRHF